jgi:hypothetical protein
MRRSRVLPRNHVVQCAAAGAPTRRIDARRTLAPTAIGSAPATVTVGPVSEALRAFAAPTPPNGADAGSAGSPAAAVAICVGAPPWNGAP